MTMLTIIYIRGTYFNNLTIKLKKINIKLVCQ